MVTPGWRREVDGLCGREEASQEGTSNTKSSSAGEGLDDSDLIVEGHEFNTQMQRESREWELTEPALSGALSAP